MLCGKKKKKNIKQKQYCNKFNKVFKNGPYKKKIFTKRTDQEEVKKKEKMNKEGEEKRAFYCAWCQVFYPSYLILPILSHFETLVSTDKP